MDLLSALGNALTPFNLMLALVGVVLGTVIGALPGLSATMSVAILVPFTFAMDPASGLIALGAIYTGAIYGGAYAAILVNAPGTPSAIATTFDGFPMAKRGDGDLAVTLSCLASVVGGLTGAFFLLVLSQPLAQVALAFGPVEYFWLAILGLSLIAALSEGDMLKALIGACFGLLISMIGVAVVGGDVRFTLGMPQLLGGVEIVSALIGLYCIPVIIDMVSTPAAHLKVTHESKGFRLKEAFGISWRTKFNLVRSALIGTFVGILPGAGGSIAGLVSYSEARRTSKRQQYFGTGEPEGVQATEAANNATVGGGFIPTMVLGIPGTPPDAVILGALLVQGIRTGPALFTDNASIVYTFIFGLFIATILMLPTGLLIGRYAYRSIVTLPKAMLAPVVAFLTVIGAYAIQNSVEDVMIMLTLGVVGWILDRFGFRASPIVLGLVLGQIAEQGFVQGYLIGNAQGTPVSFFFTRPISMAIIAFVLLSLLYPLIAPAVSKRLGRGGKGAEKAAAKVAARGNDLGGVVFAPAFVLLGVWVWMQTEAMTALGAVFPRAISTAMMVLSVILIVRAAVAWRRPPSSRVLPPVNPPRQIGLVVAMGAWAVLMQPLGFLLSSLLGFVAIMFAAQYEEWTARKALIYAAVTLAIVVGFQILFVHGLLVPLPKGILIL